MNKNYMVTAQDIVDMLGVSKGHAYKIIRQLNKELEDNGYIVVSGKIPRAYWDKKFYGYQSAVTKCNRRSAYYSDIQDMWLKRKANLWTVLRG